MINITNYNATTVHAFPAHGVASPYRPAAPRKAAAWNDDWVTPIAGGGGTPLAPAVSRAAQLLAQSCGPGCEGWLWLLTDARSRDMPPRPAQAHHARIVDFERGRVLLQRAQVLARQWDAQYVHADVWGGE